MGIDIELSKIEKMMFALLKASLHEAFDEKDAPLFVNSNDKEWMDCLALAQSNGVVALVSHGMTLLPEDEMRPNTDIRLECIRILYEAEGRHRMHCQTIVELENLFKEHGIGMMVMKGVGISTYYPNPSHRKCGDIDIYTYSLDTSKMSDEEANLKSDDVIRELGIKVNTYHYKHTSYEFKGIEIESHKCFLNIRNLKEAVDIDKLLYTIKSPQKVTLYGEYEITIPSPEFNAIFVAFHASQHFGELLSIYHLCDWACILEKYGMVIPKEVQSKGFLKFVAGLTAVSNQFLGTNTPATTDSELGSVILMDILHHPFNNKRVPTNLIKWLIFKTRYNLYRINIQKKIYDVSLLRATKNTIVFHWKKAWG